MSGILFRGNSSKPDIAGFRVQTSVYGLPIPLVYGTARLAANLIEFTEGPRRAATQNSKKWTPSAQTGWDYINAIKLALAEGPLVGIGNVWADKEAKRAFTAFVTDGWSSHLGGAAQTPYQLTGYVENPTLTMANDVLPNYSWEIKGFAIFGGGVVDASPADVLADMLANDDHGAGFPASAIDALTDFADYVAAYGLFVSPAYVSSAPLRQMIDDLMTAGNSAIVWSDGLLKVRPYGDTAKTAHGHTFTPDVTPIYDLTDNNYLSPSSGADPVAIARKDPADCFNQVIVEFENRASEYNVDTRTASNDDAIRRYGLKPKPKVSLPLIKDADVAQLVAQQILQREQAILNTYTCSVGWKFSLLEPMDLITLTDVGLGLATTPVRITNVVELEDAQGIELTAEDFPLGVATATLYPSQAGSGYAPNLNVDPGDTAALVIDAPAGLTQNYLELWLGASGGPQWGGCEVYFSTDNVSYSKVGTIRAKATFGASTATLATNAALPSIDTTHTLSVDVTVSGGEILGVSNDDFAAGLPLLYLGGEFLFYRDSSLTSAFNYDLTHLGRGAYGSAVASHGAGEDVLLCDATVFRYPFPGGVEGQTVYIKCCSFNTYGNALQSLAVVTAIAHTINVAPTIPGNGVPQGTVSLAADGTPTLEIDGPGWAQSYKYLTSTSAFPTEAAVISGGTVVDGRTQAIAVSPITIGTTIYATFLPYAGLQASGIQGQSMRLKGTYQALVATKTANFVARGFVEQTDPPWGSSWDTDQNLQNGAISGAGRQDFAASVDIPNGVSITAITVDVYRPNVLGVPSASVSFSRIESHAQTGLGSASAATTGWQTLTMSVSETASAGRSYQVGAAVVTGSGALAAAVKYGPITVTYTMNNPTQAR